MKRSRKLLLALAIGGTGLLTPKSSIKEDNQEKSAKTYERYGTNIVYSDFSQIDFSILPERKITPPSDLLENLDEPRVENPEKFEQMVFEEAAKLGYNREMIKGLSPREIIQLDLDVAASRITYHLVDTDEEFIQQYGKSLPIERYFELGMGDCDKYADIFTFTFRTFQKINPSLKNIYVSDSYPGGILQLHDWNSIMLLTEDTMILTHIDPTFYDNGGSLEAERGYHIYEKDLEILADFYKEIDDYGVSYSLYQQLTNESYKTEEKASYLERMAYLSYQLEDKPKMDSTREQFLNLCTETGINTEEGITNDCPNGLDQILYYSFRMEESKKNYEEAEKYKAELLEKFPDSYWVKQVE